MVGGMIMSPYHLPPEPARQIKKRRVFHNVFPPAASASLPTPLATPTGSFASSPVSQSTQTGSPFFRGQPFQGDDAFVNHSRAWHTATTFLSFPDAPFDVHEEESAILGLQKEGVFIRRKADLYNRETKESIVYLMSADTTLMPGENLVEWYTCEVRRHFLEYIKPILDDAERETGGKSRPEHQLNDMISQLRVTCKIYYAMYSTYLLEHLKADPLYAVETFHRSLASIISYCLPTRFPILLRKTFYAYFAVILSLPASGAAGSDVGLFASPHIPDPNETVHSADGDLELEDDEKAAVDQEEDNRRRDEARNSLLRLVDSLNGIGLMANGVGEREFAQIVDRIAGEWVTHRFSGKFTADDLEMEDADGDTSMARFQNASTSEEILKDWLIDSLMPLVSEIVRKIHPRDVEDDLPPFAGRLRQRLSRVRMREMFDIIVDFPASMPGIVDLLPTLNTPMARLMLTSSFAFTLNRRLLHQGASTVDILRAYISMIKAFQILDAKGVLLDKVGTRVRRYLATREDTVVEIVKGILCYQYDADDQDEHGQPSPMNPATPESPESPGVSFKASLKHGGIVDGDIVEEEGDEDILREISTELQACAQLGAEKKNDELGAAAAASLEDLDFDDMEWLPDPADAGPEFRKDKGTDIISHLFTILESAKFIAEFQNQLGKRLLSQPTSEFLREKATIELLKVRFGEAEMHNATVMIKDLTESRKTDGHIRGQILKQKSLVDDIASRLSPEADVHAKVISRLFWPPDMISEEEFKLPPEIDQTLGQFEKHYEDLKKARKLHWLKEEGFAVIELELADRGFRFKQVPPYAATVIHTFEEPPEEPNTEIPPELNGGQVGNSWSVDQLKTKLSMSDEILQKAIDYWLDRNIIAQFPLDPTIYYVMETLPQTDIPASRRTTPHTTPAKRSETQPTHGRRRRALSFLSNSSLDSDEEALARKNESPQKATEKEPEPEEMTPHMHIVWNYVSNMLTNGGPMTTDRMFTFLNMLMTPIGGLKFDGDGLENFMRRMEEDGKVDKTPQGWKIRK